MPREFRPTPYWKILALTAVGTTGGVLLSNRLVRDFGFERFPVYFVTGSAVFVAAEAIRRRANAGLVRIVGVDHVQLAMPAGEEAKARAFYAGVLGVPERAKPPELADRGGAWFENPRVKIHLGVEADFRPAKKAHPALLVEGLAGLTARLRAAGYEVVDDALDGRARAYVTDPFGNRLELIERT